MFVGCKLPHGLEIQHKGHTIVLNGANIGFDPEAPWANGAAPDAPLCASGVGLTQLEGEKADAFKDWHAIAGKGDGPVKRGLIFFTESKADAEAEARGVEGIASIDGLDPSKDLPAGIETDEETTKVASRGRRARG
ncbi:MAG: hypothetical protein KGR26_12085 [Cyanobacteria bacterium REEB65]|nr:hypothetical protein [Cyanobacteria bacterium REEB65]